jgi:hypothetical protein
MKIQRFTAVMLLLVSLIIWAPHGKSQVLKPLRDFQFSVLPTIGTDGRDVTNYRYQFSLNLFAGINGGVEGFEAGWFANINTGPVTGAQLSGFGNFVHGRVEGLQGAGFMNLNSGDTKAFHGAGFANFIAGSTEGFIGAGFMNVVGGSSKSFTGAGFANITGDSFQGVQGTGFANVTGGSIQGFQGAGFANIIGGNFKGAQGAGFANVTGGEFEGFQGAGFTNIVGNDTRGLMMAGFMNINRNFEGAQIAGFLNVAKRAKGLQLGFLNFADTISGVPIGFLSIVKKGAYRQIELSGSDVMHLGASFRIGVPVFYNIFSYGIRTFSSEHVRGFGYGVGTDIGLSETSSLQIELHSTNLRKNWKWEDQNLDLLNELRFTLGSNLGSRLQLFAGLVLYNQLYRDKPGEGITGADIAGWNMHEYRWEDYVSKWWIGARGGLRLRLV